MYDRVVRNIHLGLFHLKMGRGEDGTFLYRGFSKMPFFGIGGSRQWLWVSKMAFFCIGGFRKCHFVV